MALLRDFYIAGAMVLSVLLVGLSILCGLKAGYYEPSRFCSMSWSRPQYKEITQFTNVDITDLHSIYPSSYKMYHHFQNTHSFVKKNAHLHKNTNSGIKSNIDTIVIYIPGQSGSYLQIRSIASRILHHQYLLLKQDTDIENNNHHENTLFLTFNFGKEWSSVSPSIVSRQTAFVYTMLTEYLCYNDDTKICDVDAHDVDIIFIGHSMGGLVSTSLLNILSKKPLKSRSITPIDQFNHNLLSKIKGVVFISAPIAKPLLNFENKFEKFYKFHSRKFKQVTRENNIAVLSLSGGVEDSLIDAYLSQISSSSRTDFVVSDLCPSIMNTMDHQATVWCHATTETISRYILAILRDEPNKNAALHPFVPQLAYDERVRGRTLKQVYAQKMDLELNIAEASTIVVSCSYPVTDLSICSHTNADHDCINATQYMQTVPSWISYTKQNKFNFSLNHENHAFLPKFIAVINTKDISFKADAAHYIRVKGDTFNEDNDKCVLWNGFIGKVDDSAKKYNKLLPENKDQINHYMDYNVENNAVSVDQLRLSPLMVHDIKITVRAPNNKKHKSTNDYLCVSGCSGMINAAANGVYVKKSLSHKQMTSDIEAQMDHFYEQEQAYWYSPRMEFDRDDVLFDKLYLYKYQQKDNTQHWAFAIDVDKLNAYCENAETNVTDCEEWRILESSVNEQDPTHPNGYQGWRARALLSISDECTPYDVSLLHLSLNGDASQLYNQWLSLSTVHQETVHRMIVPRVNDELLEANMNNKLQFEWYLFDKYAADDDDDWMVHIEYNYLSSLVNTIIRDFQYFPFILVMSIWFGLIANIYNVKGVDLINFYMVIQCILMVVSCLDILPLNAHWRYVYVSWQTEQINTNNCKLYLIEFMLPFIYYSTCSVLLYVLYKIMSVVFKDIIFGFIQRIHMNEIFLIPWGLLEYTAYITLIVYAICGFIMRDLNTLMNKQLIVNEVMDVDMHHFIIGVLAFVSMSNLLRKMCSVSSSSALFGFYERLLCIVVIFTRWGLLFGVVEHQQYFELLVMCICFGVISYFEMKDITRYDDNFAAKALLSFCNQIYIMQKNVHKEVFGFTFVVTPMVQSIICWAVCKIIISKFTNKR